MPAAVAVVKVVVVAVAAVADVAGSVTVVLRVPCVWSGGSATDVAAAASAKAEWAAARNVAAASVRLMAAPAEAGWQWWWVERDCMSVR